MTLAVGAPIVHAAHGSAGKAVGSFFLRVGLWGAGLAIGAAAQRDNRGESFGVPLLLGAIGLGVAITIDAAELAYEDVPPAKPIARSLVFSTLRP